MLKQISNTIYCIFFFLIAGTINLYAQTREVGLNSQVISYYYPEIKTLSNSDIFYNQLQCDISQFYQKRENEGDGPNLLLYKYTIQEPLTLITVSASLGLPYETLSTLNNYDQNSELLPGTVLLVANQPGIFIHEKTSGILQSIIKATRSALLKEKDDQLLHISLSKNIESRLIFIPGEKFSSEERAFFLKVFYHYPVDDGIISSGYGYRLSPVTNTNSFHRGIDIAAAEGSQVYAVKDGTVSATGFDEVYGNFIVVRHPGGQETFFAHLKEILVEKDVKVQSGTVIGKVGNSGKSTGPHLHFEIRNSGGTDNPDKYFLQH